MSNIVNELQHLSNTATEKKVHELALTAVEKCREAARTGSRNADIEVAYTYSAGVTDLLKQWGLYAKESGTYLGIVTICVSWEEDKVEKQPEKPQEKEPERLPRHVVWVNFHSTWDRDTGPYQEHLFDSEADACHWVRVFNKRNPEGYVPEEFSQAEYMGYTTKRLVDLKQH